MRSSEDCAFASKSTGESCGVFTLKGSYVPRLRTFGVTPTGGDARAAITPAATTAAHDTPTSFFITSMIRSLQNAPRAAHHDKMRRQSRDSYSLTDSPDNMRPAVSRNEERTIKPRNFR